MVWEFQHFLKVRHAGPLPEVTGAIHELGSQTHIKHLLTCGPYHNICGAESDTALCKPFLYMMVLSAWGSQNHCIIIIQFKLHQLRSD